jgi:GAF domain-containing protein/two-component sensor histidine kinase
MSETHIAPLRPELWLAAQNEAFRAAVNGAPLEQSLGILVRTAIEQFDGEARAAFYVVGASGTNLHHVVGMPERYARCVEGFPIGPDSFACGLAAHRRQPVIARDVRDEPQWQDWREVAEEHGFCAVWSFPVQTTAEKVVGTFALYFAEPREPEPGDLEFAATVAPTASIIIAQHLIQAELRADKARQTFLLRLSDALRPLSDPIEMECIATQMLGEHLGVAHASYAQFEVEDDGEYFVVECDYGAPGRPSFKGRYPAADFPGVTRELAAGQVMVVGDIAGDPRMTAAEKAAYASNDIATFVKAPLVKRGQLVGIVSIHDPATRTWTVAETALIEEVAERTWTSVERARAEAALRDSAEQYRSLFDSIDEAFYLIEVLRDAGGQPVDILYLEENPAAERLVQTKTKGRRLSEINPGFERDWLAILGRVASSGKPDRFERLSVLTDRWLDYHLFATGTGDDHVGILSSDVTERKSAEHALREGEQQLQAMVDRQRVLVAELQHRVRNILTVVRSVFARTVEAGGPVEEIADHFRGRLDSLARTQVIVTQSPHGRVDLENLIRDELLSVGAADGPTVRIAGPEVELTPKMAESLGLAIHELTTNAIKYGALKVPGATLEIGWSTSLGPGGELRLDLGWSEHGVPAIPVSPARQGFGTELIEEALPYRLGAETMLEFRGGGICCTISVPLCEGTVASGARRKA